MIFSHKFHIHYKNDKFKLKVDFIETIMKEIDLVLQKLNEIALYPAFGAEVEFYILGKIHDEFITKIENEAGINIQSEKGNGQYEFATDVFTDVYKFISSVEGIKAKILDICQKNFIEVSFNPKPFPEDYGSAMHIHISLLDHEQINIFNNGKTVEDNTTLVNSIGGILQIIDNALYMCITNDKSELKRLSGGMMAPSTISWGKNNRTTAIRIPDSPPFSRNRRIEFRIPSPLSDLANCIIVLLTGILYGIKKQINPPPCVYGNADNQIYKLKDLPIKNELHCKISAFWKIFHEITLK